MPDPILDLLDQVQGPSARHAGGDADILSLLDQVRQTPTPPPQLSDMLRDAAPTALRVGGGVGGAVLGSVVGTPGVGTVAGGALGSGIGEYLAEQLEKATGKRQDTSLPEIGIQTALGAIPGAGPAKTLVRTIGKSALQGGMLNAGATVARDALERGELPTLPELGTAAGEGAVFGGAVGGALDAGARLVRGLRRADVPSPEPRPIAALPPAPFTAAADGRVARPGDAIEMQPRPDGSYVRSVRGEYAQRDVRGLLPPAPDVRITPPPPGSVPDASDRSFVRSVRGEYPQRDIRGALPPGPDFVAGPAGAVAKAGQQDALLTLLDEVQGRRSVGPGRSAVRSSRPAVLARELDPTVSAKSAERVTQYASDPDAVDAPYVSPEQRRVLQTMRDDLHAFAPEHGRQVRHPQDETSALYVPGTAGSAVADDIRVISGQRVSNREVAAAVEDLLAGKPPTNRLHTAALDAAQGLLEGRPGYRGPTLPMDAPALGGGAPGAVDDFERFSAMFDEIEPSAGGEPGEAGFLTASLAPKLGGAVLGAATGYATGDTPEDRGARALLGAGAGFAAGAGAVRLLDGSPLRTVPPSGVKTLRLEDIRSRVPQASQRAQGTPPRNPVGNFEPFLARFSNPLVRDGVRERLAANGGFAAQRRGVVNLEQQARLANQVAVDVSKTLPRGSTLNTEQVQAYGRAVNHTMTEVQRLAGVVQSGKATDADILALKVAEADHAVVLASLVGARAEAGRALAAFRALNGAFESGDVNLIRAATKGLREDAEDLARKVIEAGPDPLKRYAVLKASVSPSFGDKARTYFYGNILSGVRTHERNFIGNVANLASNLVVHPVAAGLDAVTSAVTKRPRTITLDELPHQAVGMLAGVEKGLQDFAFTLRHGISPDSLSQSVTRATEHGQLDLPRVELGGGGTNPFNWPGRLLDASDTLFRSINRTSELYGLAATQAKNEGLIGPRFLERMAELRTGVTPEAKELRDRAAAYAQRAVFQEAPGKVAQQLQGLVQSFPPLAFVVPFVKTPANILRQGLEFSPAGAVMSAARQGGRAGTQAQARVVVGTAAAGALAWLAATGRLSGSGPRNEADRAALMESGWRPNSIRVGDQWVSMSLFQPISVPASIVANAFEAWNASGGKADAATAAASTVFRSIDSFLDQSFLSGLFDVVQALSRSETSPESMLRTAGRMAHSLTPLSGLQRTVQQAHDPVVRKPETAGQAFAANVPGLSTSVPARLDRFGEPVVREGGPLRRAADPLAVSSVKRDSVSDELARLTESGHRVAVTLPSDALTVRGQRVPLSDSQATRLEQARGRAVRFVLERVMASPAYQRLSDEAKATALRNQITRARQQASNQQRRLVISEVRSGATP